MNRISTHAPAGGATKLTTGEVNTDIDIMGDEAGNALCDWDGGLIMIDKEATV